MDDCAKNILKLIGLVALHLGLLVMPLSAQETKFPYHGLVVTQDAQVYSGPGNMHYATDALSPGDVVVVHRHDLDGWCAIRPPRGSFSLIPEAAVKLTGNGYGEITEAQVQAWVGTAQGAVEKPLWQIKMKLGEEVQLLGEVSWPDPEGHSTIWYQIAPPNGEFRWIHLNDIQLPATELPEEFAASENMQSNEVTGEFESYEERNQGWRPAKIPFEKQTEVRLASAEQVVSQASSQQNDSSQQVVQAGSVGAIEDSPNENGFLRPNANGRRFEDTAGSNYLGPLPRDRRAAPRDTGPVRYASADAAFGEGMKAQPLSPIAPLAGIKLTSRLQEVDLRLSEEVTKPKMAEWSLGEIAMDAQTVLNSPVNQSEAVAAQRLLDKVNNFRQIQSQANSAESKLRLSSPFTSGASAPVQNTNQPSAIYDAQGWLNELVLKRGTVDSTYVLEDDQGRITHHVQAAPGLNLHRYLRSKIGIIGQRGFHQQLNLNHILVERLIVLEKPKR